MSSTERVRTAVRHLTLRPAETGLAVDRPGWLWLSELEGGIRLRLNPSERELALLREHRKTDPEVQLVSLEVGSSWLPGLCSTHCGRLIVRPM